MKSQHIVSLLILVLLFSNGMLAQIRFPTGIQLKDEVEEDSMAGTVINLAQQKLLPDAIDLSPYCPESGNQGKIQSCVGWAAGYAAMSIQYAIRNKRTNKRENTAQAFSAHFIYNQIKINGCNSNARIYEALRFLKKNGNCRKKDFEVAINDCESQPNSMAQHKAKFYRINEYQKLISYQTPMEDKQELVKRALAEQYPVIIGLKINRRFADLSSGDKYWWPKYGNTAPAGGHALVVVGYNDKRRAFRLFNSWGKEWGDKGFIWVTYEVFAKYCKYAYIFSLFSTPPRIQIKGGVKISYRNKAGLGFTTAPVRLAEQAGAYQVLGDHWTADRDLFKVKLDLPEGVFAYHLSINPNKKARLIWSLEEWHRDTLVQLPEKGAYQYNQEGEEVLCFLFNFEPLTQLPNYLSLLRYAEGSPLQKLETVMKDKKVRLKQVEFQQNQISFNADLPFSPQSVLPIIVLIRLKEE